MFRYLVWQTCTSIFYFFLLVHKFVCECLLMCLCMFARGENCWCNMRSEKIFLPHVTNPCILACTTLLTFLSFSVTSRSTHFSSFPPSFRAPNADVLLWFLLHLPQSKRRPWRGGFPSFSSRPGRRSSASQMRIEATLNVCSLFLRIVLCGVDNCTKKYALASRPFGPGDVGVMNGLR